MRSCCRSEMNALRAGSCSPDWICGAGRPALLRRNIAWSFVGTMVFSACQMGLIIVFAQWGSATIVGEFALAVSVTAPVVLFAGCALRTIQASDTTNDVPFGSYLAFRLTGLAVAAGAILGVALCCEGAVRGAMLAVGAAKCFESLADLIHGAMQRRERMDLLGKSQLLRGCGGLLAVAVAFAATHSVVVACWALAVTFAAVALCYDLPVGAAICLPEIPSRRRAIRRWFRPCWQRGRLTRLAGLAMPLGLTVVTGAFIANVCRYFLYYYRGPDELGIFAAMSWFTLVGALVATAVAHAALPHLAQRFAAGDRAEFYRLLRFLLISGALAGLLAILLGVVAGPMILATLYGPEYARHATSFTLLVASVAFSIEICYLDHALYAARRFLVQAPLNLAVGGLMLIACYAVIPQAGILGAAWITCLAAAAQMLARLGIVWRIIGEMRFRQSRPPTTLVVGVDVWPVSP